MVCGPELALPQEKLWGAPRPFYRVGCGLRNQPSELTLDGDAHGAGGAGDDLRSGVDVACVEVFLLGLGDLTDLVHGDLADLVGVRNAGALLQAGGLQQQLGCRWGLQLEIEGAILVDGDLNRDHVAALVLGGGVVGLAEFHDVDTMGTQCGADRGSRVGLSCLDLQLDEACDLLLLGSHRLTCFLVTGSRLGR
ncbi:hypothetical protein [Corynebacterium efficiens YS-314]|uniref:Uncharacterized protein n=1 Tax=Corynebacterium efficiens (strain DSM 44549 / YS-314 / AJ 12310 / JCM 11189 / NBRC 100395) TaxID=196164 RepID=Q8FSA6_COREF|nr:hypothetical protein [Corynebacterium efficiens YS-314]